MLMIDSKVTLRKEPFISTNQLVPYLALVFDDLSLRSKKEDVNKVYCYTFIKV